MQCTKPLYLKFYDLHVPCGKCRACRIARAREWSMRMLHEMTCHEKSTFVTLTYDDAHYPGDGSLSKSELQRFFKRLRKQLGGHRIRYYASGEYGEANGRAHYHAIVFGMGMCGRCMCCSKEARRRRVPPREDTDCYRVLDAWKRGYVVLGSVTYDSCRYVADYIQKEITGERARAVFGSRLSPFSLMSQGIGKAFALCNADQLRANLHVRVRGVPVGLPKYYRRVLEIEAEEIAAKAKESDEEWRADWLSKRGLSGDEDVHRAVLRSRKQRDSNIAARQDLKEKGSL